MTTYPEAEMESFCSSLDYMSIELCLPIERGYDVIVIGGGAAGVTAAASAAREGARTLLMEATGSLGGGAATCSTSVGQKSTYSGMVERVLAECKVGMPFVSEAPHGEVPINTERLNRIYDALVIKYGAELRFHTRLVGATRDSRGDLALLVADRAGLSVIKGKVYVDCTEDADLAAWAGAEFEMSDGKGGELMPATLSFSLSNVDMEAFHKGPKLSEEDPNSPIHAIVDSGRYSLITDKHFNAIQVGPDTVSLKAGHLYGVDGTNPDSVSEAMVLGRRMAAEYREALAEFYPEAFKDACLIEADSAVEIPETRRVQGDYTLTTDDYISGRSFDDEIGRAAYSLGAHLLPQPVASASSALQQRVEAMAQGQADETYSIPYRCLTPSGLRNVLIAGRCISVERMVQERVRTMLACLEMGEAAGLAAAMACQENDGDVHLVDTDGLRSRLRKYGVYLP